MKQLKDIANIMTGHVFRSKINYNINGNVNLLNMDAISEKGSVMLTKSDTSVIYAKDIKPSEIILKGDILFKAKGLNNNAVIIIDIPKNTTITASCLIIRISDKQVLPEYVCCWLNSKFAKKHFSMATGQATGLTIANVNKATVLNLPINIPSIEKQKLIVKFEETVKQKKNILEKIIIKQELLNTAIIEKELQKL